MPNNFSLTNEFLLV